MAKISFFVKGRITTYSELLYLRLNEDMLDEAQKKIYGIHMASESDLTTVEKINSVLNSFAIPKSPELEVAFTSMMQMAIYQSIQMSKVTCAPLRLTSQNYDQVKYLMDSFKGSLPEKKNILGQKKSNIDEQMSIIINSILILFRNYDAERGTMIFIGMDTNGKR